MDQVERMLANLRSYAQKGHVPKSTTNDIEQYVQTGDDRALARVKARNEWWMHVLRDGLGDPRALNDRGRRLMNLLIVVDEGQHLFGWLENALGRERPDEDFCGIVRTAFGRFKMKDADFAAHIARSVRTLSVRGAPTSAGRFVLSLSPRGMKQAAKCAADASGVAFATLLFDAAPERVRGALDALMGGHHIDPQLCQLILVRGRGSLEEEVVRAIRRERNRYFRWQAGVVLAAHNPREYMPEVINDAKGVLDAPTEAANHALVAEWLLQNIGDAALRDIEKFVGRVVVHDITRRNVVAAAVRICGKSAASVVLEALKDEETQTRREALVFLIGFKDPAHDATIEAEIRRGLTEKSSEEVVQYLRLAAQWNVAPLAEEVWALVGHASKPVREAAARALGRLGEAAFDRAVEMLTVKKADVRIAAATILGGIRTQRAGELLQALLDEELSESVRDAILKALEETSAAGGKEMRREDVEERIARAGAKVRWPVAAWLADAALPLPKYSDGVALSQEAVRYLIFRQSRSTEMQADAEARPLYALIDRRTSGDLALAVLRGFLASGADAKDRWAMAVAGLLGDDRVVTILLPQVHEWAANKRGKLAEYAVQALALLGTDAALMAVDALAIRYRTKQKNIGKAAVEAFAAAAEALHITPEELGDRVVPWLGFEPGKPRIVEVGGRKIEARVAPDFKVRFRDVEKNKAVGSLPASAPETVRKEFKELAAALKEVVKAQVLRLENLMVRQRRWPAARWVELFLAHPVLVPFAQRLVWGAYDGEGRVAATFRALEDGSLTDAHDNAVPLPADSAVGIVHPLELSAEERQAWAVHLADYEVTPPFAQMERPVVAVAPDERNVRVWKKLTGTSMNGMTFRGRAERLGWGRGSVCDAGGVMAYLKTFPTAGVDAFISLEAMFVSIDMYAEITLGTVFCVRSGSVKIGSYIYDEPTDEKDERLVPFGDVPPIVFSEVMGDLQRINPKSHEE